MTTPVLPAPGTNGQVGAAQLPGSNPSQTYSYAQLQALLPVGSAFAGGLTGEKVSKWSQNDNSSPVAAAHGVVSFDTDKGGVYIVDKNGKVSWESGDVPLNGGPNSFTPKLPNLPNIPVDIANAIKGLVSKPFMLRVGEALLGLVILVIALMLFFKGQGITIPKVP